MKKFAHAKLASANGHGLEMALQDGGTFAVQVLENDLVRVRLRPAGGYLEPRTWAIAPEAGVDAPWTGRARDDLGGFSCPPAELQQADGQGRITLRTTSLSVTLRPDPLALSWHDAQGQPLLLETKRPSASPLFC